MATKTRSKPEPKPPLRLRHARPGEVFVLILDRNPGVSSRPSKRNPAKQVREPGLSVNDLNRGGDKQQWLVRSRLQEELADLVRASVEAQGCPAFHNCRPVIQETYVFSRGARRDWRNYTGKGLLDGLVKAGVILDDSDRMVDILRPILAVDRDRPRVEIRLEAVPLLFGQPAGRGPE